MRSFPFSIDGGSFPLTLARIVKITRRDGTILRLTSNAADVIDGNGDVFAAEPAITVSDVAFRNDGTPANFTIQAQTNDQNLITYQDVALRRYSGASAQALLVDYSNPSAGSASLLNGIVADVKLNRYGVIIIEVRSRLTLGRALLTEIYQPMDRAAFGDVRNKIPVLPDDIQRSTFYATNAVVRVRSSNTGTPVDYANAYYLVTSGGTTSATQPAAYNPTPGAFTNDGTVTLQANDSWLRYAKVASIIDGYNFTLTFNPDPLANDNWYQLGQGIIRSGIFNSMPFEIGQSIASTLTISTIDDMSSFLFGGEWLELVPGYDRRLETLRDKFNDVINFRGERVTAGRDGTEFAFNPGPRIGGSTEFTGAPSATPVGFSFPAISPSGGSSGSSDTSNNIIAVEFVAGGG